MCLFGQSKIDSLSTFQRAILHYNNYAQIIEQVGGLVPIHSQMIEHLANVVFGYKLSLSLMLGPKVLYLSFTLHQHLLLLRLGYPKVECLEVLE